MKCIDCQHLDLKSAGNAYAKLGMGKCKSRTLPPATFITAAYARECDTFEAAPAEVVAKRIEWMDRTNMVVKA